MYKYLLSTPEGGFWRYSEKTIELGTLIERFYCETSKVHEVSIVTMKIVTGDGSDLKGMNEIADMDLIPYTVVTEFDNPLGKALTYTLDDNTQFFVYWPLNDLRCHFVDSRECAVAHIRSLITEAFWAKAEKEFG